MRVAFVLLPLLWLTTSCEPGGNAARVPHSFPPHTTADLQKLVQALAPVDVPSSASDIRAARVPHPYASYSNLFTYFFAFHCSPEEAARTIRTDSPHRNSITVDPLRITVTNDLPTGIDRPVIIPSHFPAAPAFPDVFYEGRDLSGCTLLSIRVGGAPDWFTPQQMRRGIADRCVWEKGQVQGEFYYDADRETMFLRFDQLRPE